MQAAVMALVDWTAVVNEGAAAATQAAVPLPRLRLGTRTPTIAPVRRDPRNPLKLIIQPKKPNLAVKDLVVIGQIAKRRSVNPR